MSDAPIQNAISAQSGQATQVWIKFFLVVADYISGRAPTVLQSFTVANLPDPAVFTSSMVYVSNEAGGAIPAFSDGVNWRRVSDRAIVS